MGLILYEEESIKDIARAIREKNGQNIAYNVSEMGPAIRALMIGTGNATNLDGIHFGDMTPEQLALAATNPGFTDPQWYEEIAEIINDAELASDETITNVTNLDGIYFGNMTPSELAEVATNPGLTDPQWYERIVEILLNTSFTPGGEPRLQEKTVFANGVVLPDSGYDGLSQVTVSVPKGWNILTGLDYPDASLGHDGDLYLRCYIDTNFFTCNPDYLVDNTTQVLATHTSAFRKTVAGPAIAVHWKNKYRGNTFYGPLLVSNVPEYVEYTSNPGYMGSAEIDGTTWYLSNANLWNLSTDSPSIPTLYDSGIESLSEDKVGDIIQAILTASHASTDPNRRIVMDVWCKEYGEWTKLVGHIWPITQ